MRRRIVVSIASFFLAVLLIASGLTVYATGAGEQGKTEHHTKFVTGVVFIWGDPNGWQPAAPMQPYVVHTSAELGAGAQDVKIYSYDMYNFDPSKAEFGKQNKLTYDNAYMPFAVTGMKPEIKTQPDEKGHVTYDYTVMLDSKKPYDVKDKLNRGQEQDIRDLLSYVSPDIEHFITQYKGQTLDPHIQGYLYFVPYVIEWDTVPPPPEVPEIIPPQPPQVIPPKDTTGSCQKVIRWSETKSHSYKIDKHTYTCNHVYTYETVLTAKATLDPSTLKSGYGFGVKVTYNIATRQVSNDGVCGQDKKKSNSKRPAPPTRAEVRVPWTSKNRLGTQPKVIQLQKSGNTFICAPNPISETKMRKIYTDVALSGTGKKPVKHDVTIVISGGGVNGVEFCQTLKVPITINGDMYEDDFTVDTMPNRR